MIVLRFRPQFAVETLDILREALRRFVTEIKCLYRYAKPQADLRVIVNIELFKATCRARPRLVF